MSSSNKINIGPVARSVPYDDTIESPLSNTSNVQDILDWLKNRVAVSASPGFTWGRSGNVSTGTWLLNDSVPSNTSGRVCFLNDAEIIKVFIANEDATILTIGFYTHDGNGINTTLLGTVTTLAQRTSTFTVSYSVAVNKQICVRVEPTSAGAGKNMVVGCLMKGDAL